MKRNDHVEPHDWVWLHRNPTIDGCSDSQNVAAFTISTAKISFCLVKKSRERKRGGERDGEQLGIRRRGAGEATKLGERECLVRENEAMEKIKVFLDTCRIDIGHSGCCVHMC